MKGIVIAAALILTLAFSAFGDGDVPVFQTAEDFVFAFDSATMPPYAVTNATAVSLSRLSWQGVTASVDGGAPVTLASVGAMGGTLTWTPASAGVWTLRNSVEGEALFTVRHGPYGTQGAGTAASPLLILDALELRDLVSDGAATDGSVFSLQGELEPGEIALPSGWSASVHGGIWLLAASVGGLVSAWDGLDFPVDFKQTGPNRKTKRGEWMPVAYSGDSWCGDAAAASTLAVTPPGGAGSDLPLVGTGTRDIPFATPGTWNLSLAMGNGTLESDILVVGDALFMILK